MVNLKTINYNRQRGYEIIIFIVGLLFFFASAIEHKISEINRIITFVENCQ